MEKMFSNSLGAFLYSVVICVLLDSCSSGVLADEPSYEGNTTVKEGDPFKITCRVSMFQVIKWQKDSYNLVSDGHHYNISDSVTGDNMFVSTISANSASPMHSGSYRCTTQYNKLHVLKVVTAQINIKANYDTVDRYKMGNYREKLELTCSIESSSTDQKFIWKWFKGEHIVTSGGEGLHRTDVSENKLTVNRFYESDAGTYSCKVYNANDANTILGTKEFFVVLKPFLKLPKEATFIEGERMELECTVYGVPSPVVTWQFENNTLKPSSTIKFLPNKKNVTDALLILDPINMNNRGNFYCVGKSNIAVEPVVSAPSYVRIKDKMAALWPFLGICAEVIILCLIIFIYEKKRNKAEFEESDTDQGPETNNATDNSGGGDVRHRK